MKKYILLILIILCMAGMSFAEQDYIVQVGTKKYTAIDIRETMIKNNSLLPEMAIRELACVEALQSLKKDKGLLYKGFFGKELTKDTIQSDAIDLPDKRPQAAARIQLFQNWLDRKAKDVPVRYLDIIKFWEIVKETDAYKVRAESGMKLDYTRIPYTFAELQVSEGKVLAQKGNSPFLESEEYNDYVAANYPDIEAFAKRSKSVPEIRNQLIKMMTGQKLIAGQFDLKTANFDDTKIEQFVASYVYENAYDDEPALSGHINNELPDMHKALLTQYENRHQKELEELRQELKGKSAAQGPHSFKYKNHLRKIKLVAFKSKLAAEFSADTIYQWMEKSNFIGNVKEAQFVMTNEEYEKSVEKALKDNNITFNDIND